MLKDPVYLTPIEIMHTAGLIKIMAIIWSPTIVCALVLTIIKKIDRG